jgi:hypothetical protein
MQYIPEAQLHTRFLLEAFWKQCSTTPPLWHTELLVHGTHSEHTPLGQSGVPCDCCNSMPAWHSHSSTLLAPRGAELLAGQSTRASP